MKKLVINNSRAFTLVELLAVIVILGIILGITIPSSINLLNSQSQRKYTYHENIVKEAVDAYIDQYGDSFQEGNENCSCYQIPYRALLEEELIKEDDIECDASDGATGGVILAYPIDDSRNNFRYQYYLNCKDKGSDELIHEGGTAPSGCCGVSSVFMVTDVILRYNDENGDIYPQNDFNWTTQNVYAKFESNDPYMAGIKGYEYSLNGGSTWTSINTDHATFSSDMNSVVQVRAVDNDGHKSSVKTYTVRIDKTAPVVTLKVNSQDTRYNTTKVNVSLSATDGTSGVEDMCIQKSPNAKDCVWTNYSTAVRAMDTGRSYDGGSTVFYAFVRDKVGNVGTKSYSYSVYRTCSSTYTSWGGWGGCSKSCGGGTKSRSGTKYDSYFATNCGNTSSSSSCNTQACPPPPSSGGGGGSSSGGGGGGSCKIPCCFGGRTTSDGGYVCWEAPASYAVYANCYARPCDCDTTWPHC